MLIVIGGGSGSTTAHQLNVQTFHQQLFFFSLEDDTTAIATTTTFMTPHGCCLTCGNSTDHRRCISMILGLFHTPYSHGGWRSSQCRCCGSRDGRILHMGCFGRSLYIHNDIGRIRSTRSRNDTRFLW